MCFSAAASFGAASVISTIGIVSYKKANHTPYRLLAMIPIFFGIQQFSEGIVWLASTYDQFSGFLSLSTYGFIFFAWIVWPIYIPFALLRLEQNPLRKKILKVFWYGGIIVALLLIYVMLFYGVHSEILDCSIKYNFIVPISNRWLFVIFYLAATVISPLVSSVGKMWLLGVLNILTFLVTKIYFLEHTISVWCFFAAITSMLILWIIISQLKNKQTKKILIN